jgi:hypothetical protein
LGSIKQRGKNLTREIETRHSRQKQWTALHKETARKAERGTVFAEPEARSEEPVTSMSVNLNVPEAGRDQPASTVKPATTTTWIAAPRPKPAALPSNRTSRFDGSGNINGVVFNRISFAPRAKRIPE